MEHGTIYYVDQTNGNDAYDGKSSDTPWKTLDKVNNTIDMEWRLYPLPI